LAMPP